MRTVWYIAAQGWGVEDDPDGIRRRHLRRAFIASAVLLAIAVLAVCVVFGPIWLTASGGGGAQRLSEENSVRSTLLSGLGGLLALSSGGRVRRDRAGTWMIRRVGPEPRPPG